MGLGFRFLVQNFLSEVISFWKGDLKQLGSHAVRKSR